MKIGTWILTTCLVASAWAQSPAPKPQATPKPQAAPTSQQANKLSGGPGPQQSAAKPNPSSSVKVTPPVKPAAPAAKTEPAAKSAKTEKQVSTSSKAAPKPAAAKPGKSADKQAPGKAKKEAQKESPAKTVAQASSVHKGKRDPFVSPIQERKVAACAVGGKHCLFVEDLDLIGIVQSSNGVIAVVASGHHTYFLRENDPLADGEVERISSDAITLRQRTSDLMGRPVVKEVTRKIGMPAA